MEARTQPGKPAPAGRGRASRPPSIDALARGLSDLDLPHTLLVEAARQAVSAGEPSSARSRAEELGRSLLQPVINATGVLLHTNLGRAPLAVTQTARYTNLEMDLGTGRRGSRRAHAAGLLARACGAEAALVVNNGAGALLLALAALATGGRVVVSRGELVEIGGGFRLPEVMQVSGARLVEVGTTNRTRRQDYQAEVDAGDVALLVKVHRSNYRMVGFTEEASVRELATLGPPVVHDIGSGLLDVTTPWLHGAPPTWLSGEPGARQSLAAGAALVTFSGDKLLGGPQSGILVGRAELVEACARHPLARALRPGALVLSALQDVALAYLRKEPVTFWRLATLPAEALAERAARLVARLGPSSPWEQVECRSVPGGGSMPGVEIPSAGLAAPGDLTGLLRRSAPVPVIARVEGGRTLVDLRTVDAGDDDALATALVECPGEGAR